MRILTVTHFFEAHGGGIERVAGQLCRHFAVLGHRPLWAASSEDAAPATVQSLPLRCLNPVERLIGLPMPIPSFSALRLLRDAVANADALVIHDSLYATSIVAFMLARRQRKPVLLIQHVADIPFSSAVLRALMLVANWMVTRNMLRAADQVVFISHVTRDAFADVPMRRKPLVLFNGVDASVYSASPEAGGSPVPRSHVSPVKAKVMLFVGRFVNKKGLSALSVLARQRPDLEFVLIGKGPINPERWLLPNVTVRRNVFGIDLAALYRAADLLLLPSVGEGYPLVVQEAMACGLPVICGDDTAHADPDASAWLTGVKVDLTRPEETASRFASAIDAHYATDHARAEMSAYAIKTYSWVKMASSIADALDELR